MCQDWPVIKGHCQLAIRLEENLKCIIIICRVRLGPNVADSYLISLQDRSLYTDPPSPQEKLDILQGEGGCTQATGLEITIKIPLIS